MVQANAPDRSLTVLRRNETIIIGNRGKNILPVREKNNSFLSETKILIRHY